MPKALSPDAPALSYTFHAHEGENPLEEPAPLRHVGTEHLQPRQGSRGPVEQRRPLPSLSPLATRFWHRAGRKSIPAPAVPSPLPAPGLLCNRSQLPSFSQKAP